MCALSPWTVNRPTRSMVQYQYNGEGVNFFSSPKNHGPKRARAGSKKGANWQVFLGCQTTMISAYFTLLPLKRTLNPYGFLEGVNSGVIRIEESKLLDSGRVKGGVIRKRGLFTSPTLARCPFSWVQVVKNPIKTAICVTLQLSLSLREPSACGNLRYYVLIC